MTKSQLSIFKPLSVGGLPCLCRVHEIMSKTSLFLLQKSPMVVPWYGEGIRWCGCGITCNYLFIFNFWTRPSSLTLSHLNGDQKPVAVLKNEPQRWGCSTGRSITSFPSREVFWGRASRLKKSWFQEVVHVGSGGWAGWPAPRWRNAVTGPAWVRRRCYCSNIGDRNRPGPSE